MIVITLQSATLEGMRQELDVACDQIRALVPSSIEVLAELRLDLLEGTSGFATFIRGAPIPLVATARRRCEGGAFSGDEGDRRRLLLEAKRAGCRFVDVEWPDAVELGVAPADRIVSWHAGGVSVPSARAAIRELRQVPAAHRKLVLEPRSLGDLVEIERLGREAGLGAVFGMGELGRMSRFKSLERSLAGEGFTYLGANKRSAASGQIVTAELEGHRAFISAALARREIEYFGLIGWPTAHSISPELFRILAAKEDLALMYAPIPVASIDGLDEFLQALRIRGLSITAPHKAAVLHYLESARVDAAVQSVGAANTLLRSAEGAVELFNFDVDGIALSLDRRKGRFVSRKALVIGAGGAARAACVAMRRLGLETLLWARDVGAARRLASELGVMRSEDCGEGPFDVVVNATGAGRMQDDLELPPGALECARLAFELSYVPSETQFTRQARDTGAEVIGGIEMFEIQAAEQWRRFVPRSAIDPQSIAREARRLVSAREAGGVT